MSDKRDTRIDGEYDRPLPPIIPNPTKEDLEKLQQIIDKYAKAYDDLGKEGEPDGLL